MFGDFFLTIAAIAFCFSGEWFYNQVQASIKILCFRKLANKMTRLAQGQTGRMLKETDVLLLSRYGKRTGTDCLVQNCPCWY